MSWVEEIAALVGERCGTCHGATDPEGEYSIASYLDALGPGSDQVANAIAGDSASLILTAVEPGSADAIHDGLLGPDQLEQLRTWVVECDLSYFRSGIHPGGILNPADPDFHGTLVRSEGWDFALCAKCHGEDFSGGKAKKPCTTCHTNGPTACNVCHGSDANPAPPRGLDGATATTALGVGAHQPHVVGGALQKTFDCSECHIKPRAWDDPGHVFLANGEVDTDGVAEVVFGELAGSDATWNRQTATCAVYCHRGTVVDTAATNTTPKWTDVGSGQAACGTCHGLPPSNHAQDRCEICHSLVADATPAIIDPARHIDGVVDVGDGSGMCTGCHGGPAGPAPPRDLEGNVVTTAIGVGAHTRHLVAGSLRGPIPCSDCHLVPDKVDSPGHIDTDLPAEVFPDDPAFDSLALTYNANPVFDRGTAQCADVYCHGGGELLAGDASAGLNRTPRWTAVGVGEAACGTCHGIAPVDDVHVAGLALTDCVSCHADTVDAFGNILITGGTSKHINGVADVTF